MTVAHVCPGCGAALTRVRAKRDPHYGLAMVLCPGCGRAAVRRRDPLRNRARQALRAVVALVIVGVQAMVLAGSLTVSLTLVNEIEDFSERDWARAFESPEGWVTASEIAWCVMVGGWLTAGLGHWRRWRAFAMWAGIMTLLQALALWLTSPGPPLLSIGDRTILPPAPDPSRLVHREAIVAGIVLVTALGIPLGLGMLRLQAINRRLLFRRRRRGWRRQLRGA
jgi:predicted RNA-binding Zn-ribbon protein involved in translation (DUF1610 family)